MAKAKSLFEIIGKGVEDFDSIKRLESDSRSIMPAPQRMFDPNDRAYKPFLSDFEFQPGGRYMQMGKPMQDVSGQFPDSARIAVGPDGKPSMQVSNTNIPEGEFKKTGRKVKTNLYKKKAGWKWSQVPEGFDPNPDSSFPIVSVEDGKKHYYSLATEYPEGVEMTRYPNEKSEPRLRPTKKGGVHLGKQVGEIDVKGKKHPVYDRIQVYGVPAAATTLGSMMMSEDAEAGVFSPFRKAGEVIIRPGEIGFDQRYIQDRKGELERANALEVGYDSRGTQTANPISFEELIGRPYVIGESDRSAAGAVVKRINDVELKLPVNLQGGQGFALDSGYGWASGDSIIPGLFNKTRDLADTTGMLPVKLPYRMGPQATGFSTMPTEVMLSYAQSGMNKTQKKAVDKAMKAVDPTWPGIDSENILTHFQGLDAGVRKKMGMEMNKKTIVDNGGLSSTQANLAISDAAQYEGQDMGLQSVIEIDPFADYVKDGVHNTYPMAAQGRTLGELIQDVHAYDIAQDAQTIRGNRFGDEVGVATSAELKALPRAAKDSKDFDHTRAQYSISRMKPSGIITPQMVDRVMGNPLVKPSAGLLALLAGGNAMANTGVPSPSQQANEVMGKPSVGVKMATDILNEAAQRGNVGSIRGVSNNPVSQAANKVAFASDKLNRNLSNAGILSLIAPDVGDISERAAYGESRMTDPLALFAELFL